MPLTNYRDAKQRDSDKAGFQFEFHCGNCSRTWVSPFKPYRRGQIADLIYKFAYYLGDRGNMHRATSAVADAGSKKARQAALDEALEEAEQRYSECPSCRRIVCEECWRAQAGVCEECDGGGSSGRPAARSGGGSRRRDEEPERNPHASVGLKCPNCSSAVSDGRFCAECGFDLASTHKSCPSCGTLCLRSTRFCSDCGHAF